MRKEYDIKRLNPRKNPYIRKERDAMKLVAIITAGVLATAGAVVFAVCKCRKCKNS